MFRFIVLIVAIVVALPAFSKEVPEDIAKGITTKLKNARPDLNFLNVEESVLPGFYQVQVESGPLLYITEDGNHFFDGSLYQVRSGQFVNVRDLHLSNLRREVLAERDNSDLIIFKPEGQTKAIINVFTDIDCGYCRKLHREVPQLNAMGIEVRYFAYPRQGIGSSSYQKIATAWCAENQNEMLPRLKNLEKISFSVCSENPVSKHFQLGREFGVSGTPAVVLMDGTLIPGYQPAASFAKIFGLQTP